ncbi:MAG: hypothetical protein K2L81_01185 [Muribaculaceae bacterium]|nr:hypothetical protein [Muribaculaceae bacterium]
MKNFLKVCVGVFMLSLIACPSTIAHSSASQSSIDSTPFPCGTCKGRKTVTDIYGREVTCPDCHGTGNDAPQGKPEVKPTQFPDAQCKKCRGAKGWNTSYGWVTCDHCHGTGKEPKK